MNEINKFEGCVPKQCKRFVTDKVISVREADALLVMAMKGFQYSRSFGGASILDIHSGALSRGQHFINIYTKKELKNLLTADDFELFRVILS